MTRTFDHVIPSDQIVAAIEALDSLDGVDREADHVKADDITAALLPDSVRTARRVAEDRAGGWEWA